VKFAGPPPKSASPFHAGTFYAVDLIAERKAEYAEHLQGIVRGAQEAPMKAIVSEAQSTAWFETLSLAVGVEGVFGSPASRLGVTVVATGPATSLNYR
jgi:hypothetical protein